MKRVFRPFLILFLALALFAQGSASACMLLGKTLPPVSSELLELALAASAEQAAEHANCHTAPSDKPETTCSACAACCMGALLFSSFGLQHAVLPGVVQLVEVRSSWQTFVAEQLDPPPRHR